MQRRTVNDRNRHKAGVMFRDETGREGYGRDYGGRDGYGRDHDGRPGFNPPFPGRQAYGGGQQYGRDFSRRENWGSQGQGAYGQTFGGWERHGRDFNGQEWFEGPPPMQFQGEDIYEDQGYEEVQPDEGMRTGWAQNDRPLTARMGEIAGRVVPAQPRTMSFAGKGPRNYRRSDDRIREDISDLLTENHELDASDIEVSVVNGEVTLEGLVTRKGSKRLAEDLAYMARGVVDVHNRLRIAPVEGKSVPVTQQPRLDEKSTGKNVSRPH